MFRAEVAIMLMLVSGVEAEAQELPSEIDLRAAYCFAVTQHGVHKAKAQIAEGDPDLQEFLVPILTELTEHLRRLGIYLLPRLSHLDKLGLTAAMERGKEDIVRSDAYYETCHKKCDSLRTVERVACSEKCSDANPFTSRLKTCGDLSWLPF
jgi:hypothetical protein